jgi:hypothetical protein
MLTPAADLRPDEVHAAHRVEVCARRVDNAARARGRRRAPEREVDARMEVLEAPARFVLDNRTKDRARNRRRQSARAS